MARLSMFLLSLSSAVAVETICSKWMCLMGINTPVRLNENGNVECMSTNHHDCVWQSNHETCLTARNNPPSTLSPLICGPNHAKEWGMTGYDNPNHWCAQAYRVLSKPLPAPIWTCLPNVLTPIRVNSGGEVECMSSNHRDCLWQSSIEDCQLLAETNPPSGIDPLVCGTQHSQEWGSPGYGESTHWCEISRKTLQTYRPWECISNVLTPVRRTISGEIQCLSSNEKDCVWLSSTAACKDYLVGIGKDKAPASTACRCTPYVGTCPASGICNNCNSNMCMFQWNKAQCLSSKFTWCGDSSKCIGWNEVKPYKCDNGKDKSPSWCATAQVYYGAPKTATLLWTMALETISSYVNLSTNMSTLLVGVGLFSGLLAMSLFIVFIRSSRDSTRDDGYIPLIN